ncbi:MbcA/ParS/Xre antitoxin family protein [Pseudomonas sp. S07E 245]|nr:MbcA/ParS/Xre antitoxin family protein [Pseudomonas sp. S07E 245]TFA88942.1 uncharacterized protein DUF2384 [Pseudomonas sp. URIL14HWK12:I1]SNB73767.1 Protein of unknown function [Pseudomonas sp. LAIL14HWK12:I4]
MERIDPVLLEAAVRVFGDRVRAIRWLTTPVPNLGGKNPADVDIKEALDLLTRLDHGFSA